MNVYNTRSFVSIYSFVNFGLFPNKYLSHSCELIVYFVHNHYICTDTHVWQSTSFFLWQASTKDFTPFNSSVTSTSLSLCAMQLTWELIEVGWSTENLWLRMASEMVHRPIEWSGETLHSLENPVNVGGYLVIKPWPLHPHFGASNPPVADSHQCPLSFVWW